MDHGLSRQDGIFGEIFGIFLCEWAGTLGFLPLSASILGSMAA